MYLRELDFCGCAGRDWKSEVGTNCDVAMEPREDWVKEDDAAEDVF